MSCSPLLDKILLNKTTAPKRSLNEKYFKILFTKLCRTPLNYSPQIIAVVAIRMASGVVWLLKNILAYLFCY